MTDPLAGHLGRHRDITHQTQALWKHQAYDTVDPKMMLLWYRLYYALILSLLIRIQMPFVGGAVLRDNMILFGHAKDCF